MTAVVQAGVPVQRDQAPVDEPLSASRSSFVLVLRVQAGDESAFAEIFTRYRPMVLRFVCRRVESSHLAEDLTSEVFLRAFQRLGSYEWLGRDLGAWLCTIARNLVADHYKGSLYRREFLAGDVAIPHQVDDSVEGTPEASVVDHLVLADARAVLAGALQLISEPQRRVLIHRFVEGLSIAKTAQVMCKDPGAVKALQFRAVRAMARVLPHDLRASR